MIGCLHTFCITGDSQPLDVSSVHHNDDFIRYSVSLLGYGFYGDVLTDSERKRWMGPARYDFSGQSVFCNNRLKHTGKEVTVICALILYGFYFFQLLWFPTESSLLCGRCENVFVTSLLWRDHLVPSCWWDRGNSPRQDTVQIRVRTGTFPHFLFHFRKHFILLR